MIYGIENPNPCDDAVTIALWSIIEVIYGDNIEPTRHLVGFIPEDSTGRVSSAIQYFDSDKRLIETSSGRRYKLHGLPGSHANARHVWGRWKDFNNVRNEQDVTIEYYWEMECYD
jgi:hypothetical protein